MRDMIGTDWVCIFCLTEVTNGGSDSVAAREEELHQP